MVVFDFSEVLELTEPQKQEIREAVKALCRPNVKINVLQTVIAEGEHEALYQKLLSICSMINLVIRSKVKKLNQRDPNYHDLEPRTINPLHIKLTINSFDIELAKFVDLYTSLYRVKRDWIEEKMSGENFIDLDTMNWSTTADAGIRGFNIFVLHPLAKMMIRGFNPRGRNFKSLITPYLDPPMDSEFKKAILTRLAASFGLERKVWIIVNCGGGQLNELELELERLKNSVIAGQIAILITKIDLYDLSTERGRESIFNVCQEVLNKINSYIEVRSACLNPSDIVFSISDWAFTIETMAELIESTEADQNWLAAHIWGNFFLDERNVWAEESGGERAFGRLVLKPFADLLEERNSLVATENDGELSESQKKRLKLLRSDKEIGVLLQEHLIRPATSLPQASGRMQSGSKKITKLVIFIGACIFLLFSFNKLIVVENLEKSKENPVSFAVTLFFGCISAFIVSVDFFALLKSGELILG